MPYIETINAMLDGESKSGNALEHGLYEIVSEVRDKGACQRDIVLMINAYFNHFGALKSDWRAEIKRFSEVFDMNCYIGASSIEFRKR